MKMNIKKQSEGFTIIEVLIVLAIAGLIMLIVFLAVPALQRSSRNTARKNDVGRVGAALNSYISNHNGSVPPPATPATTITTETGNLGQYDAANISIVAGPHGPIVNTGNMVIATGAICDSNNAAVPGSSRQMAILYAVEISGGGAVGSSVCQGV